MTDQELIAQLQVDVFYGDARLHNMSRHNPLHMEAADRIEQLVKEVERRIEPEQVEKLVTMADPIMSELYAIECSYRQEAEAKLDKAVEALELIAGVKGPYSCPFPEYHEEYGAFAVVKSREALAELEGV